MEGSVCLEKFGEVEVGTLGKKQPIEKKNLVGRWDFPGKNRWEGSVGGRRPSLLVLTKRNETKYGLPFNSRDAYFVPIKYSQDFSVISIQHC